MTTPNLGLSIGSMFSGIGGLELGLERAGVGRVAWQVEKDPAARDVLSKHWPGAAQYCDIRRPDLAFPYVEVVCGGFPCQNLSSLGDRVGLDGPKSGLFAHAWTAIREIRPWVVVLENVSAIVGSGSAGVAGWRALEEIAQSGYDALWDCLPACSIGAPHQRDRWFCIAWDPEVAYTERQRLEGIARRWNEERAAIRSGGTRSTRRAPAQPRMDGSADGVRGRLDISRPNESDRHVWPALRGESQHEWEPSRVKRRQPDDVDRIRMVGNAVVPQVAEVVGGWVVMVVLELARRTAA